MQLECKKWRAKTIKNIPKVINGIKLQIQKSNGTQAGKIRNDHTKDDCSQIIKYQRKGKKFKTNHVIFKRETIKHKVNFPIVTVKDKRK